MCVAIAVIGTGLGHAFGHDRNCAAIIAEGSSECDDCNGFVILIEGFLASCGFIGGVVTMISSLITVPSSKTVSSQKMTSVCSAAYVGMDIDANRMIQMMIDRTLFVVPPIGDMC